MDAELRGLIVAATALALLAAVPVRAQLITSTYIQASSATIVGNLGIGTSAAAARIDVRGGNIHMEQNPVEVFLSSAMMTTTVTSGAAEPTFTDLGIIGGFTLPRTMIVYMRAHGAVEGLVSANHCGFQFVVDGTPQPGINTTWGSTLVYDWGVGYWAPWSMELELSLASGTHTVTLGMDGGVAGGCSENSAAYSAARLWIYGR